MVTPPPASQTNRPGKQFLTAVVQQAVEDGHRVGQLLRDQFRPGPESAELPLDVLVRLGVILRQAEWERLSISAHQRAKLGTSIENWRRLISDMEAGHFEPQGIELLAGMLRVLAKEILWDSDSAELRLRASISAAIDDDTLSSLAEFLLQTTNHR